MNVPKDGSSIYFWMFHQGLKHIQLEDIIQELAHTKHLVRAKDIANYWRGWYKSDLYTGEHKVSLLTTPPEKPKPFKTLAYSDYPIHPFINKPEILERYVPCTDKGMPLIKWSNGCYNKEDALAFNGCKCLGENLKGCKHIVIDIDGDHGDTIHNNTINAFKEFINYTHTLIKPDYDKPISFHLTFKVDRVIPTLHFTNAHIDIIGNKKNSIRYFKNKEWNNIEPMQMTDKIWTIIKEKIKRLED